MSIQPTQKVLRRQISFLLLILCWLSGSFFIRAQQQTQTDRPLVLGRTLNSRTGIPVITVTEENMFPPSWLAPPIKARATSLSKRDVKRSLEALNHAMGEYPESFLRDNIKRIYLLGSLTFYGIPCDGTVSSDSLYIVNGGGEEYTDEYIGLTFYQAFSNLISEKNRKSNAYETSDVVRFLPQRRAVEVPSADRVMKKVLEVTSDEPDYIYALEKTGFTGVTLLKQFRNLPPESAIKCPLRCREINRSAPAPLREAIKKHLLAYHWNIEDSAPVWSHDGKQIAFQSGRDNAVTELYVMDLDGSNLRRITRTSYSAYQSTGFSSPMWSPDDRQLVYVMHPGGPSKLFVVNTDGTGQKHLSVGNGTNSGIFLIGWLPDGRILFLAEGYDRTRTIYSILPDGTRLTPLTEKRMVVSEAFLSPNQALLAITAHGSLVIIDLKTNAVLNSTHDTGVSAAAWSPDSKKIAYASGGGLAIRDLQSNTIRPLADLNDQRLERSERQDYVKPPMRISGILWSPDGKQIAYGVGSAIVQNGVSPTELHAINVDGTRWRRLAVNGFLPVWSPDARYVVFSRLQAARLYLVRADGSDERYLASGVYAKWIR